MKLKPRVSVATLAIVLVLTTSLAFARRGSPQAAPPEPIRVGVFLDLSGVTSEFGVSVRSGVELAFDDPEGHATGMAVRQRPAPGPAPRGVVCRVAFGRRAD